MPTAASVPLSMAVHQTEGSQPQAILTPSCWLPCEEGGPVLLSWRPPSPPSFLPRKHMAPQAPWEAGFQLCLPWSQISHLPGMNTEHWILWGTQSYAGYPKLTRSTTWPQQLLPRLHISSSTLLPCCCTPWQRFTNPRRNLHKRHRGCGRAGSQQGQLQTQMLPGRGRE